jgi:hypothetical protein
LQAKIKTKANKMSNEIERCHLAMPGNRTACGKQISGGLLKLRVWAGPPMYYGVMSFIQCEECRAVAIDAWIKENKIKEQNIK